MKAAVVKAFDQPLVIESRPVPTPGPGEVLVRIEASGLCRSDVRITRGDWPVRAQPPFIPGHEGVGIVRQVGPGVTHHRVGDRVAIGWLGWACGTCRQCVTGWEALCQRQRNTGLVLEGAHAEWAVAAAAYCVPVPAGIDPMEAAPLTCAGLTSYTAVKVAGVRPGELVAVFGMGGLGHLALQYAEIFGAETVAVDVDEGKLRLATDLGAAHVVNALHDDPVRIIRSLGGADTALVVVADRTVIEQAHTCLRPGGRLIIVSLPADDTMSLPVFDTVLNGITVRGSTVGSRADLADVFALHAAGRTTVIHRRYQLEDINKRLDAVLVGRGLARTVFDLRD